MKRSKPLRIPKAIRAYCRQHKLDPHEFAQSSINESAEACAEYLMMCASTEEFVVDLPWIRAGNRN